MIRYNFNFCAQSICKISFQIQSPNLDSGDEGSLRVDRDTYQHMFQDIVSIKTTLLKLKRVLQQVYRKGWLLMYFMNFINIKKRHNIFVCFIWYVYQCASVLTRTLLFFSFIIVINHDFIFKSEENGLTRVCFLLHILFWYYSFFFSLITLAGYIFIIIVII